MTQSDFNHLLCSINGLSPAQVRQLRQRLDQPKPPTAAKPGKAAKRAKPPGASGLRTNCFPSMIRARR
jgi:hypothetical protein